MLTFLLLFGGYFFNYALNTQNNHELSPQQHYSIYLCSILIYILFFIAVIYSLFKILRYSWKSYIDILKKKLFSISVSFVTSAITILLLNKFLEFNNDHEQLITIIFTPIIFSIYYVLFDFGVESLSKQFLQTLRTSYEQTNENYKIFFNTLFNRPGDNQLQQKIFDFIIMDYTELGRTETYLISVDGYLKIIEQFFIEGFALIGINSVPIPTWYSIKNQTHPIARFLQTIKIGSKLKHKRLSVHPNIKKNEILNYYLEKMYKDEAANPVDIYCWLLNILTHPDLNFSTYHDKYIIRGLNSPPTGFDQIDFLDSTNSYHILLKRLHEEKPQLITNKIETACKSKKDTRNITDQLFAAFKNIKGQKDNFACTRDQISNLGLPDEWKELALFNKGEKIIGLATLGTIEAKDNDQIRMRLISEDSSRKLRRKLEKEYFSKEEYRI